MQPMFTAFNFAAHIDGENTAIQAQRGGF